MSKIGRLPRQPALPRCDLYANMKKNIHIVLVLMNGRPERLHGAFVYTGSGKTAQICPKEAVALQWCLAKRGTELCGTKKL